nr:hypothetical protein [Tanacetum cinerariifolium]
MAVGTRSNSNTDEPLPQDPTRMTEFVTNIVNAALERFTQDHLIQRPKNSNAEWERNLDGGMRGNTQFSRVTKIEFLKFRGEDVRGWLFKCDQFFKVDNIADNCKKYTPGHKCNGQVYFLEVLGETSTELLGEQLEEEVLETEEIIEYTPHISLNAINGTNTYQTMRVCGHVGKHKLYILIDCGSTHNFLDLNTAKKLGCQLTSTYPFQVEIAGAHQLVSKYMCKNFRWKLYGKEFSTDVMIIPLGGCEMVLGIQWLSTLGNIISNFKELRVEFKHNGRKVVLRETQKSNLQWMQCGKVMIQTPRIELSSMVLCVYPTTTLCMLEAEGTKEVPAEISELISQHPPTQKDAIEVMVKELLDTVVIRDSQSPFSSPVVMDKFPIPVIEELIDELQGSQLFTKLDLKSGYHQIRMNLTDVEKTAFKTHEGHYEFLVMPFGLTNAPSTFQALMNSVFKEYLRRFLLVFFDDILVYSPTMETHVQHLRIVLEALRQNTLYAQQSKCVFGTEKVEYLGHVITKDGVATDGSKIEAMQNWPRPTNKNGFGWNEQAQEAFVKLKKVMIEAPVLKLPNFNELFIIETDASHTGIGAVLQQGGHPVAYYSKTLATRHHTLSTYEKELLAVIQALNKWMRYLLDRHFKIKTDHFSLKYLLEQRITTPSQMKWLPKLMGFDYDILYKKGSENKAADALSRIPTSAQLLTLALSTITSNYVQQIMESCGTDAELQKLIKDLEANPQSHKHYTWLNDPSEGYSEVQATIKRITGLCYWRKLRQQVKVFVAHCKVCQINKLELAAYPGLLQPLPILKKVWTEISMDFIEGLPSSYGKTAIFVVVDRLTGEGVATSPMKKKKATRNHQKWAIQADDVPRQTVWATEEEIALAKDSKTKQEGCQTYDMVVGKWKTVRPAVVRFYGVYSNVMRMAQESRAGDEDYVQRAMIHYQDETGGSSKRHKSYGSSSFNIESWDASINQNTTVSDEDEVQEIRRPRGRDKARAAAKNKGSKASGSSTMNDDALARLMVNEMTSAEVQQREAFMELKRREVECHEREIAAMEYRAQQEDIKLYL